MKEAFRRGAGHDQVARAGATAARMVLGTALCRLREGAGMSAREASAATGVPAKLITGMERGEADVRLWDVAGLYSAYGVSDLAERSTLLGLAHRANGREWWHDYRDVIPGWLEHYLGLEQAASLVRTYAAQVIPALLQTGGYARATIVASGSSPRDQATGRRVELRLQRQHVLHGGAPVRLWTVIDEAALRRTAGSAATMRDQLRHLILMCEQPNVTIRVLPFSAGAHPAGPSGPFTVLRLPDRELPDIAFIEQFASGQYFHAAGHLDYFRHVLNQLDLLAEPAGKPEDVLTRILRDT